MIFYFTRRKPSLTSFLCLKVSQSDKFNQKRFEQISYSPQIKKNTIRIWLVKPQSLKANLQLVGLTILYLVYREINSVIKNELLSFKLLTLFVGLKLSIAAQLGAGDIAFIGYNTDEPDGFSFIVLKDIPSYEPIYFTDEGWIDVTQSWVESYESHLLYTTPNGGLTCGTIVSISETSPDQFTVTDGGSANIVNGISWSLSSGDQVLAYQASFARPSSTPVFIAGVHGDDGQGGYDDLITTWSSSLRGSLGTAHSEVPTGLTNGVNCISIFGNVAEYDNAIFDESITGTPSEMRTKINTRLWWDENNTTPFNITASAYSNNLQCATPCEEPTVPYVSLQGNPTCTGDEVIVNISGTLNHATKWHVYKDACGVDELGSTATTEFEYTITDTYAVLYVKGEDGAGCVDESFGTCGGVLVSVDQQEEANFEYSYDIFCFNEENPEANKLGYVSGTFAAEDGLVFGYNYKGEIDLASSTPGTYNVRFKTRGNICWDEDTVQVIIHAVDTGITVSNESLLTATAEGASVEYQWLDCNDNYAVIQGETLQSFDSPGTGSYAVEAFDGSCKDTSACVEVTLVWLDNGLSKGINVYPNPTTEVIKLDFSSDEVVVSDINGRVVSVIMNTNSIDVSSLKEGLYFLNIKSRNETFTGSFVKVK